MKKNEFGDVIASRTLTLKSEGVSSELLVLIGRPVVSEENGDFCAPFQILGLGTDEIRFASGIDAIQALQLALGMVGARLCAINERKGLQISWNGSSLRNLGFPEINIF